MGFCALGLWGRIGGFFGDEMEDGGGCGELLRLLECADWILAR